MFCGKSKIIIVKLFCFILVNNYLRLDNYWFDVGYSRKRALFTFAKNFWKNSGS